MNYIYGLLCPVSGDLRYVGKSNRPKSRLAEHLRLASKKSGQSYCSKWLRSLIADGLKPTLVILREVPEGQSWQAAEIEQIAKALADGARLTNITQGGDGLSFKDEQSRQDIVSRMSSSAVAQRAARTDDQKAAFSASVRNAWDRPGFREKMAEAFREANTDESRAERSSRMKSDWEENREAMSARFNNPEIKQRRSEMA